MSQWWKCYHCANHTDKCRIELAQHENDNCENYIEKEFPIWEGFNVTKMPKQNYDSNVMTVSYDVGYEKDESCLLVGYNNKGNFYIQSEFTGFEADMIYKLLKKEISIFDFIKKDNARYVKAKEELRKKLGL